MDNHILTTIFSPSQYDSVFFAFGIFLGIMSAFIYHLINIRLPSFLAWILSIVIPPSGAVAFFKTFEHYVEYYDFTRTSFTVLISWYLISLIVFMTITIAIAAKGCDYKSTFISRFCRIFAQQYLRKFVKERERELKSRCDLLGYCMVKKKYLTEDFKTDNAKDKFKVAFQAVSEYILTRFFQHAEEHPDYRLVLFLAKNKRSQKLLFIVDVCGYKYGTSPSRKDLPKTSVAFRVYKEKTHLRYPHDVKKKEIIPPLSRDLKSFACIPIFNNRDIDECIGVIVLDSVERKDQLDDKFHLDLLEDYARFVSLLIGKLSSRSVLFT